MHPFSSTFSLCHNTSQPTSTPKWLTLQAQLLPHHSTTLIFCLCLLLARSMFITCSIYIANVGYMCVLYMFLYKWINFFQSVSVSFIFVSLNTHLFIRTCGFFSSVSVSFIFVSLNTHLYIRTCGFNLEVRQIFFPLSFLSFEFLF